jgi:hypothetical protein
LEVSLHVLSNILGFFGTNPKFLKLFTQLLNKGYCNIATETCLTEPNHYPLCSGVDFLHVGDLLISFGDLGLINADSINP